MVKEEWRNIGGYEGLYQVSDIGRVRSVASGNIKALAKNSTGYYRADLWKDNAGRKVFIHRMVYAAFHGDIKKGLIINHKNGSPLDNRASNLEMCTHLENSQHAWRTGLTDNRGEKHGLSKLKEVDVIFIRENLNKKEFNANFLAARFSVRPSTIRKVTARLSWKHV